MKIKTQDKIVQAVLAKMDQRSLVGQQKYGATMMGEIKDQVKDLNRFLIDVQEELMDALLYIEASKTCLQEEIEEASLKQFKNFDTNNQSIIMGRFDLNYLDEQERRMDIIGQNGNDGIHYDK